MVLATIFLMFVIALVAKMVMDVQIAKVKSVIKEAERMQILAGIKPHNKQKGTEEIMAAELTGVDIEGIQELAERFQKLAHIKDDK